MKTEEELEIELMAMKAWEEDQKTNPIPVNPHAFCYGFYKGYLASQFKTVEPEKYNTEFKCHGCGETHTGKNDDQLYEICKSCFDRI